MENGVLKLEDLSWKRLDLLDKNKTIFFVVVSPIEEHGPHLPVGVDFFIATNLARLAARQVLKLRPDWTPVLCPPMPLGTQCIDLVGTISSSRELVREVVASFAGSLAKYGFGHFVIITGHAAPGHGGALQEAAEIVSNQYKVKVISPVTESVARLRRQALPDDPELRKMSAGDMHAGTRETSLMLALKPKLVDPCYQDLPPSILEDPARITAEAVSQASRGLGYLGSPAGASVVLGRSIMRHLIDLTVQKVLELTDERDNIDQK